MSVPDKVLRAFLVERFGDFLSLEQGASRRTHEAYARDVTRFVSWAMVRNAMTPAALTPRLLRDYVFFLKDLGLAPASIRRNVSALRSWIKFLVAEGLATVSTSGRVRHRLGVSSRSLGSTVTRDRKSVV